LLLFLRNVLATEEILLRCSWQDFLQFVRLAVWVEEYPQAYQENTMVGGEKRQQKLDNINLMIIGCSENLRLCF
jgi:hypothetical protein